MQPAEAEVVQNLTFPASAGECERLLCGQDVDPLVRTARSRVAEIVDVMGGAEDREDDRLRRVTRACGCRPGQEAGDKEEEKGSSGCRPVASHELRFAREGRDANKLSGG
jgi:hypothetical protein